MNRGCGYDGTDGWMNEGDVWDLLAEVGDEVVNRLSNAVPLPEGSVGPEDAATLRGPNPGGGRPGTGALQTPRE